MVKNVIWPMQGSGGGCLAPMDMEQIIQTAMRSQAGTPELAFHWTNFNFRSKFEGAHQYSLGAPHSLHATS